MAFIVPACSQQLKVWSNIKITEALTRAVEQYKTGLREITLEYGTIVRFSSRLLSLITYTLCISARFKQKRSLGCIYDFEIQAYSGSGVKKNRFCLFFIFFCIIGLLFLSVIWEKNWSIFYFLFFFWQHNAKLEIPKSFSAGMTLQNTLFNMSAHTSSVTVSNFPPLCLFRLHGKPFLSNKICEKSKAHNFWYFNFCIWQQQSCM